MRPVLVAFVVCACSAAPPGVIGAFHLCTPGTAVHNLRLSNDGEAKWALDACDVLAVGWGSWTAEGGEVAVLATHSAQFGLFSQLETVRVRPTADGVVTLHADGGVDTWLRGFGCSNCNQAAPVCSACPATPEGFR